MNELTNYVMSDRMNELIVLLCRAEYWRVTWRTCCC